MRKCPLFDRRVSSVGVSKRHVRSLTLIIDLLKILNITFVVETSELGQLLVAH